MDLDDQPPADNPPADTEAPIVLTTREEAFAELADLNVPELPRGERDAPDPGDDLVSAPPVVAVMVTHNAGEYFDEALASLKAQSYPNLSVLIIDADSDIDPTPRIAEGFPSAFVRRLEQNAGYGPTLNEVLELVSGSTFFCFCHDDVALDPDCIQRFVEEAFRSNAGIVGPKLVDWDDPEVLLQVGFTIDKSGGRAPYAERGELDQGQHDAVRDVFAVTGACMLVRSDLFEHLNGFDPAIDLLGEDLDLCWRAHLVGGRVVVAPLARVRHREELPERIDSERLAQVDAAHRLRTVLTNYRLRHLIYLLPQIVIITLAEAIVETSIGRRHQARALISAWGTTVRGFGQVRRGRRQVRHIREHNDREISRLQTRTWARLSSLVQSHRRTQALARQQGVEVSRTRDRSLVPYGVAAVIVVALLGTRDLFFGSIPPIGSFARAPSSIGDVMHTFFGSWNPMGLGSTQAPATSLGPLSIVGAILGGAFGFIRRVAIFLPIPVGMWGIWRFTRSFESRRGQLVALVFYTAIPVPWNALAQGRWGALLVYGAAPWILGACAQAMRVEGFADDQRQPRNRWWVQSLGLGLLLGLVGAFSPAVFVATAAVVAGLLIGSLLIGRPKGTLRLVLVGGVGVGIAFLLGMPWSWAGPLQSMSVLNGMGSASHGWLGVGQILRFETGSMGAGVLAYALLIVAALPVIIGRSWRFAWGVRAWAVSFVCWGWLWLGQQSWFPLVVPVPEVLLAPASAGLAVAGACGLAAIENDLRGYRFGFAQAASVLAGIALFFGVLPTLGNAADGRWKMTPVGLDQALTFLTQQRNSTPFRVVWAGDPSVLPVASWPLSDRMSVGISQDAMPTMTELWAPAQPGAMRSMTQALDLAMDGQSTRVGRIMATMNVRYIIVPRQNVPLPYRTTAHLPPQRLVDGLDDQLDLARIAVNDAMIVYRNDAWNPGCALWQLGRVQGKSVNDVLGAPPPVAVGSKQTDCSTGSVHTLSGVLATHQRADSSWTATMNGSRLRPVTLWGWEQGFVVPKAGTVTLGYDAGPGRPIVLIALGLGWCVVLGAWFMGRRTRANDELLEPIRGQHVRSDPLVRVGGSPPMTHADSDSGEDGEDNDAQ